MTLKGGPVQLYKYYVAYHALNSTERRYLLIMLVGALLTLLAAVAYTARSFAKWAKR